MAQIIQQAKPGDLITAQDWNELVDAVNSALIRIAALEAGSEPGIGLAVTELNPDGPYHVGDRLQVIGRNFDYTTGANRVFINTTQVLNILPSSSDFLLEFDIPSVPGLAQGGSQVDLIIMNETESVTWQIILRPRQSPLQGIVTVEYLSVTPTTIVENQAVTFAYRITSGTNNSATWSLNPQIAVASNSAAWNSQLSIVNESGNPIPSGQITLDPGQSQEIGVRIGTVPTGTDGVQFGLSLTAQAESITGTSGIRQFTVGTEDIPPDETITLAPQPAASSPGALEGSNFTVPGGMTRTLAIAATFTVAGTYSNTQEIHGSTSGWTISLAPGTPSSYTITSADLSATGQVQRLMRFNVTATVSAAASTDLEIRLQRSTQTAFRSVVFTLLRG